METFVKIYIFALDIMTMMMMLKTTMMPPSPTMIIIIINYITYLGQSTCVTFLVAFFLMENTTGHDRNLSHNA